MRTLCIAVSLLVALLLPPFAGAASLGILRVSLIQGDVQIRSEDTREWVPAALNTPLGEGDSIWAPEGARVELQLRDGTFVRLDERSSLDVMTLTDDTYQFFLVQGRAYARFPGKDDTILQFDTEATSFVADRKARFRIAVFGEGNTALSALKGSVAWLDDRGQTTVPEGKMVTVSRDGRGEFTPLRPVDEWERWNRERDRKYARSVRSARYLPDELQSYSSDLDLNGRWESDVEFGTVWWPTVVADRDWSPYRVGRWVWMRGDYVWISYEPWGWVPYHYGRWAFRPGRGWCWIPPARHDVYWGPGFVGWVNTPTYTAWVPLAPGETYYGHGTYGRHSVNVTNVIINNTTIVNKVVYRNVNVNNAVTVVKHDDFVSGRRERFVTRENPFLRERISFGRPNIPPQKASVMPVVREIPQARRPPQRVNQGRWAERKAERPSYRERRERMPQHSPPPATQPARPSQDRIDEGRKTGREERGRPFQPRQGQPAATKPDKGAPPVKQPETRSPAPTQPAMPSRDRIDEGRKTWRDERERPIQPRPVQPAAPRPDKGVPPVKQPETRSPVPTQPAMPSRDRIDEGRKTWRGERVRPQQQTPSGQPAARPDSGRTGKVKTDQPRQEPGPAGLPGPGGSGVRKPDLPTASPVVPPKARIPEERRIQGPGRERGAGSAGQPRPAPGEKKDSVGKERPHPQKQEGTTPEPPSPEKKEERK